MRAPLCDPHTMRRPGTRFWDDLNVLGTPMDAPRIRAGWKALGMGEWTVAWWHPMESTLPPYERNKLKKKKKVKLYHLIPMFKIRTSIYSSLVALCFVTGDSYKIDGWQCNVRKNSGSSWSLKLRSSNHDSEQLYNLEASVFPHTSKGDWLRTFPGSRRVP